MKLNAILLKTLIATLLLTSLGYTQTERTIDLAGAWQFALDRDDKGVAEGWQSRDLADSIKLPGILQSQGFGNEITARTPWVLSLYDKDWSLRADYKDFISAGNVKVPFLSQPPKHYLGAAWYSREIDVPAEWSDKRVVLFMERPRWESTVFIDGVRVGSNRSLVAPHEYDLGMLAPGKHRIAVRVDNRMLEKYRPDAHSVSDSLGMSWNGIIGKIELQARSPVWIDDVQVFPDLASKSARIAIRIGNKSGTVRTGTIAANGKPFPVEWSESGGTAEIELDFPDATAWNEFHPDLKTVTIGLEGGGYSDSRTVTFGFAAISAEGRELKLNGRTIYLRGTHHGGDFPLTGYPPTDVGYWRKIFKINKDWGINHIRFHSFCPPDAAFQAADELGIYLQPEPGMWNEVSPDTPMETILYEETDRMIRAYGNHPSFLLLSPSNEPKGRWKDAFDKWIAHYRKADPRRLYTNGTGHTEREVPNLAVGTDYLVMQRIGPKPLRGNSAWFGKDYAASLDGIGVPVLSHELGQWVAYPDFDVIKKFTGYLRPGNYEIFRESARKNGVLAMNKQFAMASGKFQLNCYKEEIEANLRTPGMAGFQLLDLHDYIGQGTALVGLLDTFWEEKAYVTAKEFRRFNGETVPLARLYKRTFSDDERFEAEIEIAHFGEKPIEKATVYWKIIDSSGSVADSGQFERSIPVGKNNTGTVAADLSRYASPGAFKLVVGVAGTEFENDWNFWVYPAKQKGAEPKEVLITHSWDEAEAALRKGGKVLYMPRKADLDWTSPPLDTVPVFWNRLMNPAWGRMLGLWVNKSHPALAGFPTGEFNDWQWNELVRGARAVNLDRMPKDLAPIVQPIDDWNRNYRLGLVFEARVGRGKFFVSSADLENKLDERIAARQLRRSILEYMASDRFDPKTAIDPAAFRSILFPTRIILRLGALTDVKEQVLAFDGDPNTFWIAGDQKSERRNRELVLRFPKAVAFSGFVLMPRQNHRDHEGDIREYSFAISDDGRNWREIKRGEFLSTFDPQTIPFGKTIEARYIKLVSLSGFGADKTTAIAEFALIYKGPRLAEDTSDLEYRRVKSASADIDESVAPDVKKPKKP